MLYHFLDIYDPLTIESFTKRLSVNLKTLCWDWQGTLNRKSYGEFNDGHKKVLAHRFSYRLHNGPIPKDFQIDHTCHNRKCVNPAHLEAVSFIDHISRTLPKTIKSAQSEIGRQRSRENCYKRRQHKDLPNTVTAFKAKGASYVSCRIRHPVTNERVHIKTRTYKSEEQKLQIAKELIQMAEDYKKKAVAEYEAQLLTP